MPIKFGEFRNEAPPREQEREHKNDIHTAITFLLAGIGMGSLMTLLLSPRRKVAPPLAGRGVGIRPSPAL